MEKRVLLGIRPLVEYGVLQYSRDDVVASTNDFFQHRIAIDNMLLYFIPNINMTDGIACWRIIGGNVLGMPTLERALLNCILYPDTLVAPFTVSAVHVYLSRVKDGASALCNLGNRLGLESWQILEVLEVANRF